MNHNKRAAQSAACNEAVRPAAAAPGRRSGVGESWRSIATRLPWPSGSGATEAPAAAGRLGSSPPAPPR